MKLKRFLTRPPAGDKRSTLVDWTVLLTGIVLLALSLAPAVSAKADKISGDTLDRVSPEKDWLPS